MINKFVNILVDNSIVDSSDKDIYYYGVFVILFNFICIVTMILLGILFNKLDFTLAFLLFYIPYRIIIGGFHCSSSNRCYFVFNFIFSLILLLNILINITSFYLYTISILLYVIAMTTYYLKEKNRFNLIILVIFFSDFYSIDNEL